jgi:hypothetical protein
LKTNKQTNKQAKIIKKYNYNYNNNNNNNNNNNAVPRAGTPREPQSNPTLLLYTLPSSLFSVARIIDVV